MTTHLGTQMPLQSKLKMASNLLQHARGGKANSKQIRSPGGFALHVFVNFITDFLSILVDIPE